MSKQVFRYSGFGLMALGRVLLFLQLVLYAAYYSIMGEMVSSPSEQRTQFIIYFFNGSWNWLIIIDKKEKLKLQVDKIAQLR